MLAEPVADKIDEAAVVQGIARTGGDLDDLGFWFGTLGRHGDDGGRDEIHGDDVDDALGDTRELLEQPTCVTDDDGLGHAEAADPARGWLGECGFDDGWAHDADGNIAAVLDQCSFSECLGIGVGIGPPQRGGTGTTGLDHAIGDPGNTQTLGLLRQQGGAGSSEFASGIGPELLELLGRAALGIGVESGASCALHLTAPVHVDEERTLVDEDLWCAAAPVAGHITGGHGDQMRCDAKFVAEIGDASRAHEVDLDRGIQR